MTSAENISLIVALVGGLLSFLSPCVLPLVPSYLSFISGASYDDLRDTHAGNPIRRRVMLSAVFFVLGFSTVFLILGASFSFLGRFFASYQSIIQKIAGIIIIFFGLYIAGVFKLSFLMRTKELLPIKTKPTGYLGSTIVGFSFGAAWTPCIGPILGSILTLAASAQSMRAGVILLMVYSIGLAIPFLLTAWASGTFLNASRKLGRLLQVIHIAGGIFLIIIGILIVSGYFKMLNFLFIDLTPAWLLDRI